MSKQFTLLNSDATSEEMSNFAIYRGDRHEMIADGQLKKGKSRFWLVDSVELKKVSESIKPFRSYVLVFKIYGKADSPQALEVGSLCLTKEIVDTLHQKMHDFLLEETHKELFD